MKLIIKNTTEKIAKVTAKMCRKIIEKEQAENGIARIVLSTGASQLPFFAEFIKQKIDWSKVEMFHLDEYVGVDDKHIASFKKYLTEKFVDIVKPFKAHLIDGTANADETIKALTAEINKAPICLGLIGIGENAHIAFNDPPADFEDKAAFNVVNLSETCKAQQVREKWFKNADEVCKQAISMTCRQILKCKTIISFVPYNIKAKAIYDMLTQEVNNLVPATLLKTHADCFVILDKESSSLLNKEIIRKYK